MSPYRVLNNENTTWGPVVPTPKQLTVQGRRRQPASAHTKTHGAAEDPSSTLRTHSLPYEHFQSCRGR